MSTIKAVGGHVQEWPETVELTPRQILTPESGKDFVLKALASNGWAEYSLVGLAKGRFTFERRVWHIENEEQGGLF